ncbi:MAG: G8 domain-containing protein [Kiritimatiellae bacterium]|nr:G8 domain-containing protein [Kiritimatiellia bacterium]
MKRMSHRWGLSVALAGLMTLGAKAANEWTPTTGTNDWFDDDNWSLEHYPQAGEDVVIANAGAGVLLTNSTAALGSLTISNSATLVFTNWTTALNATTVTIGAGGTVTCAGPFTNAPAMSNRVYIVCTDLNLAYGGKINVDSRGYSGGTIGSQSGNGPGNVYGGRRGAAYGGYGGWTWLTANNGINNTYGSASAPTWPGSGGAYDATQSGVDGGHGGGAVRLEVSGTLVLNGTISAVGGNCTPFIADGGHYGAGGSGGGIYITCSNTVAGTTGVLQADGGAGMPWGGNGGGGRIALVYDAAAQRNVVPRPTLQFLARTRYDQGYESTQGDIGTVFLSDNSLLIDPINVFGQLLFDNLSTLRMDRLTVSNTWVRFAQEGINVFVTNDVLIVKGSGIGRLDLGGADAYNSERSATTRRLPYYGYSIGAPPVLTVGGNLVVTNGASMHVFAAPTNTTTAYYGARVAVEKDVNVSGGSWIFPHSHYTNGGSAFFSMRSLIVAPNAGFNADDAGWAAGYFGGAGRGPGGGFGGFPGGGGSYGGLGGKVVDTGKIYGSSNAPALPGSGGFGHAMAGGFGGGLIWVQARERIVLGGTLTANGGVSEGGWGAGGSGGGVYLRCKRFVPSVGAVIRANGGTGASSGGGGGGRIAVWRVYDSAPGVVSNFVDGATGASVTGGSGTLVYGWLPPAGTVILIQ